MSYHMKYQLNAGCCVRPTIAALYEGEGCRHVPRRGAQNFRSQLEYWPRRTLSPASHVAAQTPHQAERRFDTGRRETLQQALLTAANHDIQRIEQRPSLVGEVYLDAAGVLSAQNPSDVVFLFHAHQGTAESRLLHHRATDDLIDRVPVAHGEHGEDAPTG